MHLTWGEYFAKSRNNMTKAYQKLYPCYFDAIAYLVGWSVPDFVKFNGEDSKTTNENISQYLA